MTCERPEATYDYSRLPTLVLNEIFGYLSVKERLRCRCVCRTWKEEIELREAKSDSLAVHLGAFTWNMRWAQTNGGSLVKFANSFELKRLDSLEHPLIASLLEKTKKLVIVGTFNCAFNPDPTNIYSMTDHFKQCMELEIRNFKLQETLTLDLPKLKVLAINECPAEKLVLNCPLLEVLFWNRRATEIVLQDVSKLRRLICFGWPVKVSPDHKFECLEYLEYLNLFVARGEHVNDRLLESMPNLKRIVLYSNDSEKDLESIFEQKKQLGLTNLDILFAGFRAQAEVAYADVLGFVKIDSKWRIEELFDYYPKLVEDSPWKLIIDYSQLFSKFKILPSDFFKRFSAAHTIEISSVASYTHLYEFLKCYPLVERLRLEYSKLKADRILDLVHLLQHSLVDLVIVEERPSDALEIDLSFMRRLSLVALCFESTRWPVEFIRKVAANRSAHFRALLFQEPADRHRLMIYFPADGPIRLSDVTCELQFPDFFSIDELITYMQNAPVCEHLKEFCC